VVPKMRRPLEVRIMKEEEYMGGKGSRQLPMGEDS